MPGTLADRLLDLAAGCPVDNTAYHKYSLNLPRLTAMGKAYRAGWLANVLARATPLTTYSIEDYVVMADLFVADAFSANNLLQKMSADLNAFAAAAGINPCTDDGPAMNIHMALYNAIGGMLNGKFGVAVPAAFSCATLGAAEQRGMMFTRKLIDTGEPRLPAWLNSDPDF